LTENNRNGLWKGAEDNMLSAALSPNAFNGYVNSIKISPEDKLVLVGNWMTVEVCCYFWIQSQEVLTDQIMGMKQMLLHLLEDLIILIIQVF
jgi:hypothetical protein